MVKELTKSAGTCTLMKGLADDLGKTPASYGQRQPMGPEQAEDLGNDPASNGCYLILSPELLIKTELKLGLKRVAELASEIW